MLDLPDGAAQCAVIGLVLGFTAWTFLRQFRAAAAAPGRSTSAGEATPATAKAQQQPPRAAAAPVSSPAPSPLSSPPSSLDVLPSLSGEDEEEDEDAEITQVTASPLAGKGGPTPDTQGSAPPVDKVSNVEVIYEDEADVDEVTSPIARILVSGWGQTDKGLVRHNNEDSLLVLPEQSTFAVADGMGGYKGGEIASAIAMETLRKAFESGTFDGQTESKVPVPRRGLEVAQAIQMANHAILTRAKEEPKLTQMGTTLVATRFSPNKQRAYIGHVGDSRCYRLRANVLRQLTTDHTMSSLGLSGPGSDHLYQAVGIKPTIHIDMIVDKPRIGDVYVLCSDGLPKMATDEEITRLILGVEDMDALARSLIALANAHGGKDNVTVILVKVAQAATPSTPPKSPSTPS